MIEHILIATDGSAHSQTALEYGIYIAGNSMPGSRGFMSWNFCNCRPVFSDISGSIGIPPCQEFLPVMENTLETKADAILKAFRQSAARQE